VAALTRLWPEAMKTVVTSPPELDLRAWQPSQQHRELALLLPETADCSTVLFDAADELGVECWLVTDIDEHEGKRRRSSAECSLMPDLTIEYGHIRQDEEVNGAWQRVEGYAVGIGATHLGLLTQASSTRLVYAGERVTPIEGCVGVDLLGCPNEKLAPWQECRACDKTALFFIPQPMHDELKRWPICLSECPWPPHRKLLASLGDLGFWRARSPESANPVIFADAAACEAEATSRTRSRR
jgi:hypothetical protein